MLLAHDWPGNIRELENVIARVVTLSASAVISAEEFSTIFSLGHSGPTVPVAVPATEHSNGSIRSAEKETILRALHEAGGNQTRAAQALGMGRNTLWRKLKKYDIDSHT